MSRQNILKIIKITAGCCLAIGISLGLGLQYSTAAGVIALLSIQNTKKETLLVALKRIIAYFVAVLIAYLSFQGIGYNLWAFGVYLLFFIGFCIHLKMPEVMAICTVLVAHFWVEESMSWAWILNETGLIIIGVGVGVLLNLYMPRQLEAIRRQQRKIEDVIRGILEEMSVIILGQVGEDTVTLRLEALKGQLYEARAHAYAQMNNTLVSDMGYYVQYLDMRNQQIAMLRRMHHHMGKLTYVPKQAKVIAQFIEDIALTFHEYNNALDLIQKFERIHLGFREDALPITREEFEVRAVLLQILYDLEHFLLVKKIFAEGLTAEQKSIFWNQMD